MATPVSLAQAVAPPGERPPEAPGAPVLCLSLAEALPAAGGRPRRATPEAEAPDDGQPLKVQLSPMRARGGGAPPTKGCISGGLLEPVAGPSTPLPPTPGAAAAELPISSRHLIRTPPGLELAAPPSPARSPLRLSEHLPVKARHSPDAWAQQTPTCTDSTCTPGGADEGDAVAWPRPAALQLNPGSALHGTGACRPCSWFWTAVGCQNRAGCLYCHACPEGASTTYKRQNKLLAARSRRLARELEAAAPRARPPAGARAESEGRGAAAPRARQLSKHLSTTDGSGSDRGSGPEQEGPAAAGAAASPLEDTDWRVSIAALQALCAAAEMGDSRVLGAVVSCLEHVREDVWRATAEALAPADEGSGPVASRPEASAAPAPAPALLAETAAPAAVRLELMPVLEPSRDLPNAGSAPHGTGACRPCAFFWQPVGCEHSVECSFCHLCPKGTLKDRKKSRRDATKRLRGQEASRHV